jgi:IMP cyclohydrolase
MTSIHDALNANPYPGRLIILARTPDGALAAAYALTGRSDSSKARRLEPTPDGDLAAKPVGDQVHDALRHYVAATADEQWTVYGNGEQVGEVAVRLAKGATAAGALEDLSYEPDPPIHTPRITAVVDRATGRAWFGAARRAGADYEAADTVVVRLGELEPGQAVLLSTYESDGQQVNVAQRHQRLQTAAQDCDTLLDELWTALDPRFRVAATAFDPLAGVLGPIIHEV